MWLVVPTRSRPLQRPAQSTVATYVGEAHICSSREVEWSPSREARLVGPLSLVMDWKWFGLGSVVSGWITGGLIATLNGVALLLVYWRRRARSRYIAHCCGVKSPLTASAHPRFPSHGQVADGSPS